MKFYIKITIITFLYSFQSYCQEVENNVLDTLYLRSLNSSMSLYLSSGYKYFEPNIITQRIKSNFSGSVIQFPIAKELFKIARKKDNNISVYRCTHKIISPDTIDINIAPVSYEAKRGIYFNHGIYFKKVEIQVSCGGTEGYVPDFRYVYNRQEKVWENISGKSKLK